MITNRWNLTVCCSKSSGRRWVSVVLVRRLTEWQHFHFWYQPRDALNSGSWLNSFAFRRTINPLTAIPMQNEVRRLPNDRKFKNLTRLEFVLTSVKTGQWESFIHNIVTWYYDSFESHRARSIQPKFPEISVQNSMDRFGPTGKVSKKRVHLLRWTTFPGRTSWNFGWMDQTL